jgi:nucleoside-diphosphate-sugar epimerase
VTRDLFRAARGSGIPPERFIFASTTAVYGFDSGFHADELTPTRPLTQYGQSKQQAEQAVLNGGGMVLRLPIVYGPGDRGNMARLITAIGRGRFLLPRGATQPRSMLASANAAEGFLQAMRHPTAAGIFLLTDCDDWSIRDITECVWAAFRTAGRSVSKPRTIPDSVLSAVAAVGTVMESLGLPPPISLASLRKLTTPLTFSCKKSATVLSYRPAVDVGTALALATEAVTC